MTRSLPVLPPMRCDDGCGECCGPVPASPQEYETVVAYARERGIQPLNQGLTCPWYQGGRCAVHEVRPTLCRLFGHVPQMQCSRGHNRNVSREVARELMLAAYQSNMERNVMLHAVLDERAPVGFR